MVQSEADMTSLESIVLPLTESRALVENGIVLDTAISWEKGGPIFTGWAHSDIYVAPAPVLSELLDAIRARVDDADAEFSSGKYRVDGKVRTGLTVDWGEVGHVQAFGDIDLLAAAALLMEVSK
jgi:hypothetical protein